MQIENRNGPTAIVKLVELFRIWSIGRRNPFRPSMMLRVDQGSQLNQHLQAAVEGPLFCGPPTPCHTDFNQESSAVLKIASKT